jgi:hypothetical protein
MMSPAGGRHGRVAHNAGWLLGNHVRAANLGVVYAAETGFLISRNPDTVRAPDVAYVSAGVTDYEPLLPWNWAQTPAGHSPISDRGTSRLGNATTAATRDASPLACSIAPCRPQAFLPLGTGADVDSPLSNAGGHQRPSTLGSPAASTQMSPRYSRESSHSREVRRYSVRAADHWPQPTTRVNHGAGVRIRPTSALHDSSR